MCINYEKGALSTQKITRCCISIFLLLLFQGIAIFAFTPSRSIESANGAEAVLVRVQQSENQIHLTYRIPKLTLTANVQQNYDSQPTTQVGFPGAIKLIDVGEPIIPAIPCQVILPPGKRVKNIVFHGGNLIALEGKYLIEYGEPYFPISMPELARKGSPNNEIYESTTPYPKNNADLVTVQHARGVTIAYINLSPILYTPKERTLSYYEEFSITVFTQNDPAQGTGIRVRKEGLIKPGERAENPSMLQKYVEESIRGTYTRGMCNPRDEYSLVIVTNKDIIEGATQPSIDEYVEQKKQQGWTVKVADIDEIKRTYSGSSNPEKLRAFIKSAYNDWKTEAVFLIGDTKVIPLKMVFDKAQSGYEDDLPTDIPYQCLDGNTWKDDYKAEVIIGRACAENAVEASNILRKIIAYENSPASESYLKSSFMVGEDLGAQFNPRYAKPVLAQLINGANSANTKGFSSIPEFTTSGLYDQDSKWAKSKILEIVNSDKHSLYTHYGHCNFWVCMKLSTKANFTASNLTNSKYTFLYSYGCIPGAFDKDCIAEVFTTGGKNGFWGVVLNSRYGWGGSMEGPSHQFGRKFWDAFASQNKELVGVLNQYAHEENIPKIKKSCIRWCFLESNLLSDPTVKIRGKKEPLSIQTLSPNGGESMVQGNETTIKWISNLGEKVKIELLKEKKAIATIATDIDASTGTYTWKIPDDLEDDSTYTVKLTVSKDTETKTDESNNSFTINTRPKFISDPIGEAFEKVEYSYAIKVEDGTDTLLKNIAIFPVGELPKWLSIIGACKDIILTGTPEESSTEEYSIVLGLQDIFMKDTVFQKFDLTVKPLAIPKITKDPEDRKVDIGTSTTFSIETEGKFIDYQWQRRKKNETDYSDISGEQEDRYTLEKTKASDNGSLFRCVVKNPAGEVISKKAKLEITITDIIIADNTNKTTSNDVSLWPNPISLSDQKPIQISFPPISLDGGTITIYDALGNIIDHSIIPAKASTILWDLTNTSGKKVAIGSYCAVLCAINSHGNSMLVKKIIAVAK